MALDFCIKTKFLTSHDKLQGMVYKKCANPVIRSLTISEHMYPMASKAASFACFVLSGDVTICTSLGIKSCGAANGVTLISNKICVVLQRVVRINWTQNFALLLRAQIDLFV